MALTTTPSNSNSNSNSNSTSSYNPPPNLHPVPISGTSLVATASSNSSLGTSHESSMHFPLYRPTARPPLPSHSADGLQRHSSDALNLRSPAGQTRKPKDEDDFAVPIFSQPAKEQCNGPHQSSNDDERCPTFSPGCSALLPNACNKETDKVNSQDVEHNAEFLPNSDPTEEYSTDTPACESSDGAMKFLKDASMSAYMYINRKSRSKDTDVDGRYSESKSCGPIKEVEGRNSSRLKSNSHVGQNVRNEFDSHGKGNELQTEIMDRCDYVSQISKEATVLGLDISPDDVVGVIGLKHFWKARTTIANQQRVFAFQVFELHRLIKVQKLMAESPEVLLESSGFLGKSSKKHPTECTVKPLADSNVVAKAHVASQLLSQRPLPFGSPAPVAATRMATHPKTWSFPLQGRQYL